MSKRLTEQDVAEIKRRYIEGRHQPGIQAQLSRDYETTATNIQAIISGRSWGSVGPKIPKPRGLASVVQSVPKSAVLNCRVSEDVRQFLRDQEASVGNTVEMAIRSLPAFKAWQTKLKAESHRSRVRKRLPVSPPFHQKLPKRCHQDVLLNADNMLKRGSTRQRGLIFASRMEAKKS